MCATRLYTSGSLFFTHSIFAAVQPVSAGFAVISTSLPRPTRAFICSTSAEVRWSHQIMLRRRTLLSLPSITSPCICPEIPMPLTSCLLTPLFTITAFIVSFIAFAQSEGSCSA